MKNFILFCFWQLINIILSMGIGLNISYLTHSKSLGQIVSVVLISIISLVICNDYYPNGIRRKLDKKDDE